MGLSGIHDFAGIPGRPVRRVEAQQAAERGQLEPSFATGENRLGNPLGSDHLKDDLLGCGGISWLACCSLVLLPGWRFRQLYFRARSFSDEAQAVYSKTQ